MADGPIVRDPLGTSIPLSKDPHSSPLEHDVHWLRAMCPRKFFWWEHTLEVGVGKPLEIYPAKSWLIHWSHLRETCFGLRIFFDKQVCRDELIQNRVWRREKDFARQDLQRTGAAMVDGCRSRCEVWEGGKSLGGKIQKFYLFGR